MGEYAIRKADGARIKIGTMTDMYYIRFEDRDKVRGEEHSVDIARHPEDSRFRLPFIDEDGIPPGQYDGYNRYAHLTADFTPYPETVEDTATMQVHHQPSGLLLNIPCYHGLKLPDVPTGWHAFWNGKSAGLVLSSIRVVKDHLNGQDVLLTFPVVRCRFCNNAWRYNWDDVLPHVADARLRERLRERYAANNPPEARVS